MDHVCEVWSSEDNFRESALSFHPVGSLGQNSGDQDWWWGHLSSPIIYVFEGVVLGEQQGGLNRPEGSHRRKVLVSLVSDTQRTVDTQEKEAAAPPLK